MSETITEIALKKYAEELKSEVCELQAQILNLEANKSAADLADLRFFTKLIKENIQLATVKSFAKSSLEDINEALFKFNHCANPELVEKLVKKQIEGLIAWLEQDDDA